jgi:very-short-patch-repair endonuclease
MNNIEFYNHKYNTIESLLTNKGDINTAIIRREWFPQLKIYKLIFELSKELDIFENIKLNDRIFFILNKEQLLKCPICGQQFIIFKKSQRVYRKCNHKFFMDRNKLSNSLNRSKQDIKEKLSISLSNKNFLIDDKQFNELLDFYYNKKENYNFLLTKNSFNFFHDVIIKTINIIPIDINNLKISERLYLLKNNIKEYPSCLYCNNLVTFRNRKIGYSKVCTHHNSKYGIEKAIESSLEKLKNEFRYDKYTIIKFPSVVSKDLIVIKCNNCGKTSEWCLKNGMLKNIKNKRLCRHCEIPHSLAEDEIMKFLQENYNNKIVHKSNSRQIIKPYELDFYLPYIKLAIEYDGLFWHSEENGKDKNYHLMKTNMRENQNIKLIHIFENEWIYKQDIVKSRLKNLLGIYDKSIYARKCEIVEINQKESSIFLSENHIQGSCNAKINIALKYNNEIVSIMTFSKCRFRNTLSDWELVRFCNKLNYHIPGAASKLLKYFEQKYIPQKLISYADRRWSKGNLYQQLGFKFIENTRPNYWYFKKPELKLYNRLSFQKHKLCYKLEHFDVNKTEHENMKNNGYNRIYDCGNMVFEKVY